jgi:uncharacterized protein
MSKTPDQPPFLLFASGIVSDHTEMEGDCACPTWSASERIPEKGKSLPRNRTVTQTPTYRTPLSGDFSLLWALRRHLGMAVLDDRALAVWNRFATPESTTSAMVGLPVDLSSSHVLDLIRRFWCEGFLEDSIQTSSPMVIPPQPDFVAWIQLTDQCNLNCSYCYVPRTSAESVMSEQTGRLVVDAIFRSAQAHGYGKVKIKYAGGEPLLHFARIESLHRYATQRAAQLGIALHSVVLSNGTLLTPPMLKMFQELQLALMISMDELPSPDKGQRSRGDGHRVAVEVQQCVDLALHHGVTPLISITLTNQNAPDLPGVVRWALTRNLRFSISFVRKPRLAIDRGAFQLDADKAIPSLRAAFEVIERDLPPWSLLYGLLDHVNLAVAHTRACGVGQNYLVFDCKGNVTGCHMQTDSTVATAAMPDPLSVVRTAFGQLNADVDARKGCQGCDWRYWCGGGCPGVTLQAHQPREGQSPYCSIYRSLLPDVLRLEGLRILKRSALIC